jgi:enoyl-CoA hydratase/carnithine racemase
MADEPAVTYQVSGGAARITLNRPKSRNALSTEVTAGLLAALDRAGGDDTVRVAVLTGAGDRVFCAGGDLSALGALGDARRRADGEANRSAPAGTTASASAETGGPHRLFQAFRDFGKPVIARLAGHALGGGLGLAVSCDLAIAADDVKLGTPEINAGLWPMMIMAVLGRNIPPKQAFKLYYTGEPVSAAEAVSIGLLTEAVPRDRLDGRVDELADAIAAKSPAAVRMGRAAFFDIDGMPFSEQVRYLSGRLAELAGTEDAQEGIAAFLGKRPPRFTGR